MSDRNDRLSLPLTEPVSLWLSDVSGHRVTTPAGAYVASRKVTLIK